MIAQTDIDHGRLIGLVGVAAVKPAEFVILRIALKASDSRDSGSGGFPKRGFRRVLRRRERVPKVPGLGKYAGITLKRGVAGDDFFQDW